MGFLSWLKSKTVKEEIIFQGENLYEKIKADIQKEINDNVSELGLNKKFKV